MPWAGAPAAKPHTCQMSAAGKPDLSRDMGSRLDV
jgi:hypothetical protein